MVVFLANRTNLQRKRLHDRIKNRLSGEFTNVRRRRATQHEAGPYRVVGSINPRQFLGDDAYPVTDARIEIGFRLRTGDSGEHYWFNWIEPDRQLLVGWHRDDTHEDLGPVHLQVDVAATVVDRQPAWPVDSHPLNVVERRLCSLDDAVAAVECAQDRPAGLDTTAAVVAE